MAEYISSEELQRHQADVFAREEVKAAETGQTEKDKVKKVLDVYINKHSSTKAVREFAKESESVKKYGADYQLDLSADIVTILEKIKSELR